MKSIRGVNDFHGLNAERFDNVVKKAKFIADKYSFQYLITPILEYANLFERNLGDDTDIVQKEIYKFQDRNEEMIALRPEFTAGVVRAVCENDELRSGKLPLKLFSFGPVFRYERPQSGRYREFNQLNYEIFGSDSIETDIIILKLGQNLINELRIQSVNLKINFIGGIDVKNKYIEYLNEYFSQYKNDLSELSRKRLASKKSLRILDSKEKIDQEIAKNAKSIEQFYDSETKKKITKTLDFLNKIGIKYEIDQNLVRGLDYYTSIVFEFLADDLESKSQKAILAGGRYDKMISQISNEKLNLPAIGFGAGIERLMQIANFTNSGMRKIGIIPVTENENAYIFNLHNDLIHKTEFSNCKFEFIFDYNSVSKRMKKAVELNCEEAIIIGEDEIKSGKFEIKKIHN